MDNSVRIAELKAKIVNLKKDIDNFEIDQDQYVDQYDDMLNECHGEFMGMQAAYILKNTDETAYGCGLNDYVDGIELDTVSEYKELTEELEELEEELEELED